MKKIMMIAAMMVAVLSANAQNEVGQVTLQPKVGMTIATITGAGDQKAKVGLAAGVEAEFGVAQNFSITAGALYSMEGCKYNDVKFNFDYIDVPVLAQYYLAKGFAAKAGLQFGFNVRHKASYDGNSIDVNDYYKALGFDTKVQSFNMSIPVGLSYEYESFVLDARYNIGVSKIFKNTDEGRGSVFMITVGYKFAL